MLDAKGFETLLPIHKSVRRRADRIVETEEILFPGYVFCRLELRHRLSVLTTPGVIALLGVGKVPAPVPTEQIEAIRNAVSSGLKIQAWPRLEVGEQVLVQEGPLRGIEGIVLAIKGTNKLVISLPLLRRSIAVELGPTSVVRVALGPKACAPAVAGRGGF